MTTSRSTWALRRAFLLAYATLLSTCSLLVDPESLVIKCEVDSAGGTKDPCMAAGMHCVMSECKACTNAVELCNGIDDDCDGVIDNGLDEDGDGFTWCGGGVRAYADCAPSDPKIHPAGPPGPDGKVTTPAPQELCDGKDNDCDGKVDEAPECAVTTPCTPGSCTGTQICNSKTGMCIEPRPVGSGCTSDSECAGGFCVHPGDFGLNINLKDDRCATACCNDADCGADSVCVANNNGARLCMPASIAGRAEGQAGDRCMRDQDCTSGVCDRQRCAARCVAEPDCKGNGICALSPGSLSQPRLWLCGDPQGRDPAGAPCSQFDPTACRTGGCTDYNECAKPCGRDADCGSDEVCGYSTVRPLLSLQASIAMACVPRAANATADSLCCTTADCSKNQLCAPKAADTNLWVMTCK
jgi:hypothetical protein